MLKKAKWVDADQSHLPVSHVAAEVICQRLDIAQNYMPLAAEKWRENDEHVHQLRVATRRATAALKTFADMTPPRRAKKIKHGLRKLRRAAGEARDLDVLAARLCDEIENAGRSALRDLLDQVAEKRKAAQQPIQKAVTKLQRKGFSKKCDALCERIRWRSSAAEPTYGEAARALLRCPVDQFFVAAKEDLSATEKLHALRIAGKRLRYTMELLSGAFDDSFRDDLYVQVRDLQNQLGQLNDHAAANERFLHWADIAEQPSAQGEFQKLAAEELAALKLEKKDFLAEWTTERWRKLKKQFRELTPA